MFLRAFLLLLIALPLEAWSATPRFYTARADLRRCPSPMCGGLFVKAVNEPLTQCADRQRLPECYVSGADLAALNLDETQIAKVQESVQSGHAIVRGTLRSRTFGTAGQFGELVATEVWDAATNQAATGTFFRVVDQGIVCITFPCPTLKEERLNATMERALAGVDLSGSGATEEMIADARGQMKTSGGILVSGFHKRVTGPAGQGLELVGNQYFLPVSPAAPQACYVGGCSSQICSEQPGAVSTCEYRPEYACYRTAVCGKQPTGRCGWTPSEELTRCLENARNRASGPVVP